MLVFLAIAEPQILNIGTGKTHRRQCRQSRCAIILANAPSSGGTLGGGSGYGREVAV